MILLILQMRTHPRTRAENIDPKQGRLEPQKGLLSLEKMKVFAISKFYGARHPYGLRCYAPRPMDGYGGVLGSH